MTKPKECENCGFTYTGPCPTCEVESEHIGPSESTKRLILSPNDELIEPIENWLDGNYVSPQKFKDSARALLEQLELKESEYQSVVTRYGTMAREFHKQKEELEQVKAERDNWRKQSEEGWAKFWQEHDAKESLRTELAAKDKVLETYASGIVDEEARRYYFGETIPDIGRRARIILSQYKGADTHERD